MFARYWLLSLGIESGLFLLDAVENIVYREKNVTVRLCSVIEGSIVAPWKIKYYISQGPRLICSSLGHSNESIQNRYDITISVYFGLFFTGNKKW